MLSQADPSVCLLIYPMCIQGRPHTAESRAKISAANKGKTPWNKGLGHSEETKARIRERTKLVRASIRFCVIGGVFFVLFCFGVWRFGKLVD